MIFPAVTYRLKFRFALLASVLLTVVVAGGILSYRALERTADIFATYVDTTTPRLLALTELDVRMAHMRIEHELLAQQSSSTSRVLSDMLVELGRIEQTYRSYRAFGATNEQFTALLADKETYVYALLALRDSYLTEGTTTRDQLYRNVESAHDALAARARAGFAAEAEAQRVAAYRLNTDVASGVRTQLALAISTMLALVGAVALVYGAVLRPLGALRETSLAIARGDTLRTAESSRADEIGDVARGFNIMVQRMRAANDAVEERAHELDTTLTELAQITKTTTEERALFEELLGAIADAVVVFDASRTAVFANTHARRIMGDGIVGAAASAICLAHREGSNVHTCLALVDEAYRYKESKVFEREYAIVDTRGVRVPVSITVAPVRDAQGVAHHLILTFRDVTELVRLEEARVSFLSAASHQLRTPLSSMRWFSEMFLDGNLGKLTPKQRDAMQSFSMSTMHMIDLVNSLLQLSRVEARRVEIKPEPIDVLTLAREVAESVVHEAHERGQRIDVASRLKKAPVSADRELVRQAILNLVTNAIRYANADSTITVTIRGTKTEYVVEVTNEGVGVPEADKSRIFEKFYRAPNAQKMVPNGNGVGLALVKFLVEDWGGTIGFESEPGKVTTFHFSIPKKGMSAREGEVSLVV